MELTALIKILVGFAGKPLVKKAARKKRVISILKRVGLDPTHPPADFESVYAYALVEFATGGKPAPLLQLFELPELQGVFRRSFDLQDPDILIEDAESVLEKSVVGDRLREQKIDWQRELQRFNAVFATVVDRSRYPADARRDAKLTAIHEDLHDLAQSTVEDFQRLDALEEIKAEVRRISHTLEARRFASAPSPNALKVLVSSSLTDLRDVRDILLEGFQREGIRSSLYIVPRTTASEFASISYLEQVESADIYIGLFWLEYSELAIQEFEHARALGKPCFIYVRDAHADRDPRLQQFLDQGISKTMSHSSGPREEHPVLARFRRFNEATALGQDISKDILAWLLQRYREMTAEIAAGSISPRRLEAQSATAKRLQAATSISLPKGNQSDYLAALLRPWFGSLGYELEDHDVREERHFEWILKLWVRGRRYDQVVVIGVDGEATALDFAALERSVATNHADEGWLVSARKISPAVRKKASEHETLLCYTLDELIDVEVDFDNYFEWLEREVKRMRIGDMYVPLACVREEYDPLTNETLGRSRYDSTNGWIDRYIDEWLEDPSKEHVSILGEFGTGKTWFALHYAWKAMQLYRESKASGSQRPRVPIFVPLRDYAKAVSVESLFSEFFFRKHEIDLPGYSAFEQLNRMGKLLLIFDGFDEMAARVDRQQMINNFWELARVVVPGSKAILTCRSEHFPEATQGRDLLSARLQASTSHLSGNSPQFEVLELEKFDDNQIRTVLGRKAEANHVEQVMRHPQLLDLTRRPVMTDFVIEALPDIQLGKQVDIARVYLYATRVKMERDIKADRTFTDLAQKLYFLCELSWEMLSKDQMSINYRLFPDRIRQLFGKAVQEEKDLDHWHHDMMGQTMLIRNADGDYTPAHRSLLEFFVAYKFAAELGVLAEDFVEVARDRKITLGDVSPRDYQWSAYFSDHGEDNDADVGIAPLGSFSPETSERLAATFGGRPLTRAVSGLLKHMISEGPDSHQSLLDLVRRTGPAGTAKVDQQLTGGNLVNLMLEVDPNSLSGKDLSKVRVPHATFLNADLTDTDLRSADLSAARFVGCTMKNTDMSSANLTDTEFLEVGSIASLAIDPANRFLASGGDDGNVSIWSLDTEGEARVLRGQTGPIAGLSWNQEGDQIASCSEGDSSIYVWRVQSGSLVHSIRRTFPDFIKAISYLPDGRIASAGGRESFGHVRVWDARGEQKEQYRVGGSYTERLAASNDGSLLASVSVISPIKRNVTIVYRETGELWEILDPFAEIEGLVFTPRSNILQVLNRAGNIFCYDPSKRERSGIVQLNTRLRHGTIAWDGGWKWILSVDDSGGLGIWETLTGHRIHAVPTEAEGAEGLRSPIGIVSAAPNGTLVVSGSQNGVIKFWDSRVFVTRFGEPRINLAGYISPEVSGTAGDKGSWASWWQAIGLKVPEDRIPNPALLQSAGELQNRLNCSGLRLYRAKGVSTELRHWLEDRGAVFSKS